MSSQAGEVASLIQSKAGVKYVGAQVKIPPSNSCLPNLSNSNLTKFSKFDNSTNFTHTQVDSMKAIAHAYLERSLHLFQKALSDFHGALAEDKLVSVHLHTLYGNLMEQNLLRLVEPYSRVEVAHLAKLIDLPVQQVETKLSQMILDKTLRGTIDQVCMYV